MNVSLRYLTLATILASAVGASSVLVTACGGGGDNKDAGGTDAAKEGGGGKDAGVKDTGGGDADDGGTGPTVDPQCTVPAIGDGGCSPPLNDAGVACNAITNAGCDGGGGEACDFDQNGGLSCFPPPNVQAVCATCDNGSGPFCKASEHCVPTATGFACARMCCSDSDCTPGTCDKTTLQSDPLGFCVK
jgi:hypothetical protein